MRYTMRGMIILAGGMFGLLVVGTLGALSANAFHAATQGPDDAAEQLRLTGALLAAIVLFLAGILAMLALHVSSLVRTPLEEVVAGLRRLRAGAVNERIVPQGPQETRRLANEVNAVLGSLQERQGQLERAVTVQTIDALLSGVAHEVHTPLTSLRTDNHLLHRQFEKTAAREDLPEDIREQARMGLRLVERAASSHERLGRLTRALGEVVRDSRDSEGTDINLLVAAAVAISHHRSPGSVNVESRLDASRRVACPASDVFHAVHALVLQASDRVHERGTITVWTEDEGHGVRIRLHYTGAPTPPELLEFLHEPARIETDSPLMPVQVLHRLLGDHSGTITYRTDGKDHTTWDILLRAGTDGDAIH